MLKRLEGIWTLYAHRRGAVELVAVFPASLDPCEALAAAQRLYPGAPVEISGDQCETA